MMSSGRINVLHVDDEPDFAEVAAEFLERENDRIAVRTATSAAEGLDAVAGHRVDCIVSDYDMPELNGIEFLEAVREAHADLPFVLFTGKGSEAVAGDAIAADVTDYLQKEMGTDQYAVLANRVVNAVAAARAETELEETLSRVTDAIYTIDAEWRFTYVNERAEQILQQSEGDLLGSVIWEEFPEAADGVVEEHYRSAMETQESVAFEYRYDPLDLWLNINVYPSETGLSVYFQDVTDRKEHEQSLTEERQRVEALLEHSTDVITVIERDGVITYESPAVERVLGYDPEELLGRNGFENIHPEDRERVVKVLASLTESPDPVTESVRYRFQHKDGSWVWLESVGSNRGGGPVDGYVLNSRAIEEHAGRDAGFERVPKR